MKVLVYGTAVLAIAAGASGLTGCQALEAAKNSVVAGVAGMGLKSDIEKKCAEYEASNDGKGLKAYLLELQKKNPKPEGWSDSLDELVRQWLAKADTMVLKMLIQAKYDQLVKADDIPGVKDYMSKLLALEKKPAGWDESVAALVKELLAKAQEKMVEFRCGQIWTAVKAALDQRDFATARKLTSTAAPEEDEMIRNALLVYRVGVLNEVINPYQSDWTVYEMQTKVAELKESGKADQVQGYLDTVPMVVDEIPSIAAKVKEIAPSLKNLYWLDDRINDYLSRNVADIQYMIDTRAVSGQYRDYKEVFDLVDAAVAEMKLYNPTWDELPQQEVPWDASMRNVRRVMTTLELNEKIVAAKGSLLK